ncbi:MAG: hypothetical protein ACP5FK_10040 [bacterium]
MPEADCLHEWKMTDVNYGFIVTEKCFHCGKISNYFTGEQKPPFEEYREGEHFWNFMDSYQTFRFSLKCSKCSKIIDYPELAGLKMCIDCDKDCKVSQMLNNQSSKKVWYYIAFGFLPQQERKYLDQQKIKELENYFNQRRKNSKTKIVIVPQDMVKNFNRCYSESILDKDMLSLTLPQGN